MEPMVPIELVLRLAAQEAIGSGYPEITPAHLLISLSRLGDSDEPLQINNNLLKSEFDQLGIDPRRFRRRLRALLGNRGEKPPEGVIHRSPRCRGVFALAQAMASQQGVPVGLEHLLCATLVSLAVEIAIQPASESETECPACHAHARPSLINGEPHCAACGKKIASPSAGQPPPAGTIPTEL